VAATSISKVNGDDFLILPNAGATRSVAYTLFNISYNNRSAGTRYLHVFTDDGSGAVPANSTVPILPPIEVAANKTGALAFENGVRLAGPGLIFAVSSTKDTFTAVGAATDDIHVVYESVEATEYPSTASVSGDYTSAVTNRVVWNDAAGPKRLFRLEVRETSGNVRYIQIHAQDSPADGQVPVWEGTIAANEKKAWDFGAGGFVPKDQSAAFALRDGCTVVFSTTAGTKTQVGAASGTIRAIYL
jgi:hypothetical protein